ncbi:TAXI family TRAP transporter solute-binding subunit [uncultured Sphaerotilus sp.]|uniref:TAXI family TRAP transporter solute-binding subunit n=1 Tax=uncultured Sphaerotilus sp. TaxID=474984 RepID=UPI0030CA2322
MTTTTPLFLTRHVTTALALALSTTLAAAQTPLAVSTGIPQGTYASMFKDLTGVCGASAGLSLVEKPSSGSNESVDRLLRNEVSAAFVQTDVLHARRTTEDLGGVKALVTLHPEPVHLLALTAPLVEGGVLGLGGRDVQFNTLGDLGKRRVGVWGGALVTARLIQLQAEVDYRITEFTGPEDAMQALRTRRIDAVMAVGGAPLAWMRGLDRSVKLLSVPEPWAGKLRSVYRPAKLSYSHLGAQGVATVATEAVLAVRDVRSAAAAAPLLKLRTCLQQQLDPLRDTVGHHSAWSQVEAGSVPHWPVFERGGAGVSAQR